MYPCAGQPAAGGTYVFRNAGPARTLLVDGGETGGGNSQVLEFTSAATNDLGSRISCRFFGLVPTPDPLERQVVSEVRLDYRAVSASSLSVRLTPDFGTTYPVSVNVALPPAPFSAQTSAYGVVSANYVGVDLQHDSGHTFVIQGLHAVTRQGGHG